MFAYSPKNVLCVVKRKFHRFSRAVQSEMEAKVLLTLCKMKYCEFINYLRNNKKTKLEKKDGGIFIINPKDTKFAKKILKKFIL